MTWAQKHGIQHILIEPGSPTQNAYIESFNSTFRDECLDENWFESLDQAAWPLPSGDSITTKPDRRAAVGVCRLRRSPH